MKFNILRQDYRINRIKIVKNNPVNPVILSLFFTLASFAADGTFEKADSGLLRYSNPLYWNPDVARGVGATATFKPRTAFRSMNLLLDEDLVIGQMLFTPLFAATIQNGDAVHTITFDNAGANSLVTIPGDRAEVHFDVPVVLANNTTLVISKTVPANRLNASRFTQPVTGRGDIAVVMATGALGNVHSNILHFAQSVHISGGIALHGSPATQKRPEYLVLSAPNTYPGGTRVLSGKLAATAPAGLGTGDIVVGAYGELRLEAPGATHPAASLALFSAVHDKPVHAAVFLGASASVTNTVSTLLINGVKHPPGFYTAKSPEAARDYFSGRGVLRVADE